MNNDDIKRDFVRYMEEKHVQNLYPKNYFGCMMAVFVEQEPITQDRIKQLTGYSKTTISQILKLIPVNFPLKQVKKPNIRKKYYTIDIPVRDFMMTFLKKMVDSYRDKVDFIPPLIEEIRPYIQEHPKFCNFKQFLEKFYEMAQLYIKLTSDTAEEFRNLIKTGQVNASELFNLLSSQENLAHIQTLLKPTKIPPSFPDQRITDEKLSEIYTQFKNKYYQKVRENLTLAGSQTMLARTIIGTELLLEQRPVTQEEIEHATNFQRSIISNTLKILLEWKMIQVIKKPGDRKKYYMAIQSWDTRMINRLRLSMKYAIEVKGKITNLMERINPKNRSEDNDSLLAFFQDIYHSYDQFEQYFKFLEVKYLNIRLKEYLELKKTD